MTYPARPLDVARAHLQERLSAAERAGHWRECEILSPLGSVADMVCRIGDHPDSAHYRASKAGPLVDAALAVQLACLQAHLGTDGVAADALDLASVTLTEVASAVRSVMWAVARSADGEALDDEERRRLRQAVAKLSSWADAAPAQVQALANRSRADAAGGPSHLLGTADAADDSRRA